MPNQETASLSEIIECLEKTYCGHLSVELSHISVSLNDWIDLSIWHLKGAHLMSVKRV